MQVLEVTGIYIYIYIYIYVHIDTLEYMCIYIYTCVMCITDLVSGVLT